MIKTLIAAVTAAASLFLALSTDALADRRVALVIGNSQYNFTGLSLTNPKNDASDVAGALRTLGFEVIEATNTSKRDFDMALAQFARRATDADSALFFYAGHAMQYQGRNYLMPVDAELEDEISVRYQMIAIDDVRAALDRAPGVRIMILDACRNNPLAEQFAQNMTGQHRSIGSVRGLARIDKTQGMVVAYSTAADEVAMDGQGRNSPYTVALLKRLQEPGLEIEMMFRRIAADVNAQTNGKQRPETYVSLLNEYYLNQADRTAWNAVKDSSDPAALRGFITRFPSSPLLGQAEARLQLVERTGFERPVAEAKATETKATETKARDDADELRRKLADAQQQILQNEAAERERRAQAEQQAQVQQQAQAQQQARLEAERQAQLEADRLAHLEAERKVASVQPTATYVPPSVPTNPAVVAPVIPSDTPALVSAAQRELKRLGCYSGDVDGRLSAATRAATWRYLSKSGRQGSDGSITAIFVTELKQDKKGSCAAEKTEKAERSVKVKPERTVRTKRHERTVTVVRSEPVVVQQAPVIAPRVGFGFGGFRRGFGMHF